MNKSILFFCFLLTAFLPLAARPVVVVGDSVLNDMEAKIGAALTASFRQQGAGPLEAIDRELETLPSSAASLRDYWLAYSAYYQAIYHLNSHDTRQSKDKIAHCISRLKNLAEPTSEDYALLALAQGFSLQFASGIQAGVLSSKIRRNAEKACELDPSNPRAWYVRASQDYYTPKSMGGGEKTEAYLLKTIALDDQSRPDSRFPRWGKREAYRLLITFYLDRKDREKAQKYIDKGLFLYPDDYLIHQCAAKLEAGGK